MLTNVLGVYLDSVKEREFDLPFITLLHASSFNDVHFTHGSVEFGKDFIAKVIENGSIIQYSFQTKAGDISQSDFRNDIMGQILESILLGLSHPNFDKDVPHQTVLVITGKMSGNAAQALDELNEKLKRTYRKRPIILWDRENLISLLDTNGLGGVYQATSSGYKSYGDFYQLYGKALEGHITQREIEQHSRHWLDESLEPSKGLICSAIEASIFASQCQVKGRLYEGLYSHFTLMRTIMFQIYQTTDAKEIQQLRELYEQSMTHLKLEAREYLADFAKLWDAAENNLSSIAPGPNSMMTYLIHCARILEVVGCLYFIEEEQTEKDKILSFLVNFIEHEPGCAHVPSDNYAVSLVLPVLALLSSGKTDIASRFLHQVTVWLCDRYQEGFGLADIAAEPYEEIIALFGYPFEFINVRARKGSFVAPVICDLAVYTGDADLYSSIVNDFKATNIIPQYWQVPDTDSLFKLDGKDIIAYPKIDYNDNLLPFEEFSFADHIKSETTTFNITQSTGQFGLFIIMLLLRDRYFPTLWPSICN